MICKHCAYDADMQIANPEALGAAKMAVAVVLKDQHIGHAACPGGTHCDCQHKPAGSQTT